MSANKENESISSSIRNNYYKKETPRQRKAKFSHVNQQQNSVLIKKSTKPNLLREINENFSTIHSSPNNTPTKNNHAPLRETHRTTKLDGNKNFEIKIKKAINYTKEIALANSTTHNQLGVNFMQIPEIANFDAIGIKPKINFDEKRPLGSGISKVVVAAPILKLPQTQTATWKERAVAIQKNEYISTSNAYSMIAELRVQQILSKIPRSSETIPKNYFSGIIDGKFVMITKIISGGEAKNCLPYLSIKGRLKVLLGFGKGLKMLHDQGITHNDVAMRNMLVELSSEKINVEESIGRWLAEPILDDNGKRSIPGSILITSEISNQIKKLKITEIKVFSEKDPQGKLTDFGLCMFKSESLDPLNPINYAADSVSPECHLAINAHDRALAEYKKSHVDNLSEQEKRIIHDDVLNAARNVAKVRTSINDLLPFGQVLCHVILRPDLDTDLDEKNEDRSYFETSKKRLQNMDIQYKNAAGITRQNAQITQSAIASEDFEKIKLISPQLADLAFNLQKYIPSQRTKLVDALKMLEEVIEKDQLSATSMKEEPNINWVDQIFKNVTVGEEKSNQSESSNESSPTNEMNTDKFFIPEHQSLTQNSFGIQKPFENTLGSNYTTNPLPFALPNGYDSTEKLVLPNGYETV